jgi:hypothetical protein
MVGLSKRSSLENRPERAVLFFMKGVQLMTEIKIVGRGVDTLVLNVCYADKQFQPIKQELDADLQEELNSLQGEARINESPVVTQWAFKGFNLFMKEKGSRGQWRWIMTCPLVTLAISRGRLNQMIAQVRLSSEYLWSCETVSDAIVEVSLLLFDLFGEYLWVQVSEVDLCADSIGWDVASTNWQEDFVSQGMIQLAIEGVSALSKGGWRSLA